MQPNMFTQAEWDCELKLNAVDREFIDDLLARAAQLPASKGVGLQQRLREIRPHVPSADAGLSTPRLIGHAWRQAVVIPLRGVLSEMSPEEGTPSDVRPVQRQQAQESVILSIVQGLGLVPTALPKATRGLSGVKAQIRAEAVSQRSDLFQGTTFDKAWERLRKNKQLRYTKD